jgi:hypothetical protein
LGYDHEIGLEASQEMEEEETRILSALGWKGKGLISASSPEIDLSVNTINNVSAEALSTSGKGGKLFSLFAWSNNWQILTSVQ